MNIFKAYFKTYYYSCLQKELTDNNDVDTSTLYWIPKLHKDPYIYRFIASSAKCSFLSKLLTTILATVKEGLKKYCDVIYYHMIVVLIKCGS